jgi:hypothetical protein
MSNEQNLKDKEKALHIADVVAMLPSEYSWQKHQWKSKASLKTTINELVTLKELSKKELILLVELIKDHLGN